MEKAEVVFTDTLQGIRPAVNDIIEHHGGVRELLKESGDVYIKVNAVDSKPYSYTDIGVLEEVIRCFREGGARDVFVIENCTQGNFTRLVFRATGIADVCKRTGARPVYLDETDAVPVYLEGLQSFIDISSFVYERLVEERERNLYVSIPKLKTHSMSGVTISIKNQFGLVHQSSRVADHNFRIHQKFADIYRILRPDLVIVDGIFATNHGHYFAEALTSECLIPVDCLVSGRDPLAVDVAAASFIGFGLDDVEHLRLAAQTGIGQGDIRSITILNRDLYESRRKNLTHELLDRFPPDVTILRGRERCCMEGCRCNTEMVMEALYNDYGGKGGFTILMGKGIDPEDVKKITGPAHIAGSCAFQDYGPELIRRLGGKSVTTSLGCNSLADTIHGLCTQMKVSTLKLAGINPLTSLGLLLTAKVRGTRALIPPVL